MRIKYDTPTILFVEMDLPKISRGNFIRYITFRNHQHDLFEIKEIGVYINGALLGEIDTSNNLVFAYDLPLRRGDHISPYSERGLERMYQFNSDIVLPPQDILNK